MLPPSPQQTEPKVPPTKILHCKFTFPNYFHTCSPFCFLSRAEKLLWSPFLNMRTLNLESDSKHLLCLGQVNSMHFPTGSFQQPRKPVLSATQFTDEETEVQRHQKDYLGPHSKQAAEPGFLPQIAQSHLHALLGAHLGCKIGGQAPPCLAPLR